MKHPAPRGWNFVARGFCLGYDDALFDRLVNGGRSSLWRALRHDAAEVSRAVGRILRCGDFVGLGVFDRLAAACVPIGYYGIAFLGYCISMVSPGWVPRHFRM